MSRVLAWSLATLAAALAPVGVALALTGEHGGLDVPAGRGSQLFLELVSAAGAMLFGVVGVVVVRKQRRHPIGWLFLGTGVAFGVVGVATGYADLALYGGRGWPGGEWAAWLAGWLVVVPAFASPCIIAQLFPGGRPLAERWRLLFRLSLVAAVYLTLPAMLRPGALANYPTADNPLGLPDWVGTVLFDPIWALAIFVLLGVSLASLTVRFRRSREVERQQLTWLALAAGIALAGLVVGFAFADISALSTAGFVVAALGLVAMPIAVGIAVLRYRLYEIDRVISKTLVYGSLSVVLGAAYVGLVLAGQWVFSAFAGGSGLAVAVSTLVVAALFLPLRAWLQRFVDRRFYRHRYDAQRTLEAFGARLRQQVELDGMADQLVEVVVQTMRPGHATVWLRRPR